MTRTVRLEITSKTELFKREHDMGLFVPYYNHKIIVQEYEEIIKKLKAKKGRKR